MKKKINWQKLHHTKNFLMKTEGMLQKTENKEIPALTILLEAYC